ncbi:MAG TPA: CAP domain-containing protein [Jatrophihabitans sp.]|jgi:uncharacterized protein YkwD|uniref:CAP domain-containing protein n=1 Tax=Jatrophihabitans sp. TaxID=1932789 RepID=UPI002EF31306
MPAAQAPTLWLSAAATAISAVAVVAMASSEGPRRPLTFAAGILLPDSRSSAASEAVAPPTPVRRPTASRTVARTSAAPSAGVSSAGYQPPVIEVHPVQHTSAAPSSTRAPAPAAAASFSATPKPAVSSSSPANTPRTGIPATPSTGPSSTALAQALFSNLNTARKQAGLPALSWDAGLQRSAAVHNQAMAAANQFASRVGDEPALGVRQANQGVMGSFAAESSGYTESNGMAGAVAVQQEMLAEQDGRRENLMSTAVNAVGIDVLYDPAHGRLWVTEDFAQLS